jgi:thioredoxin-related protein
MRKIFIFIVLCTLPASLPAQNASNPETVKWYTIQQAIELNKKSPRKIIIDVYTDWCGWCKEMDKKTFSHPVISKYLNDNFYPVKFNAESSDPVSFGGKTFVNEGGGSRSTHQFAVALLQGKMSYPSIAYMNEKMELLTSVPGYLAPKDIEPILNYFISDKYKAVSFEEFQKSFTGKIK